MNQAWNEIRYRIGWRKNRKAGYVVILIHPWKSRWAMIALEDMQGFSVVDQGLGVAEAKEKAKILAKSPLILEWESSLSHVPYREVREVLGYVLPTPVEHEPVLARRSVNGPPPPPRLDVVGG